MDVLIRPITLEDVPAYREAMDIVCRERRFLAMVEAPPLERLKAFVAGIQEHGDPQMVAEAEGRIVGWCDIRSGSPTTGNAHVGQMVVGVIPEYRRHGVARRLIEAALVRAKVRGLEKVEFRLYSSNTAALALMHRCGFVEEGRRRRGRLLDGIYDDVIELALFLKPTEG